MKKKKLFVFMTLFVIFIAYVFASSDYIPGSSYTVSNRDFEVKVFGRGEIIPRTLHYVVSEISNGNAKLVFLIEEGRQVKKGDVIARFDTSKFQEDLIAAEQKYADAVATLDFTQKNLEIQREAEAKKIDAASSTLQLAKLEADQKIEGLAKIERQKFIIDVEQANRSLKIAAAEAEDFNVLYTRGHISLRELEKARDEAHKLEEFVSIKQREKENFDKYSYPMLVKEIEVKVKTAEADYKRALILSDLELKKYSNAVEKSQRDVEWANKGIQIARANIDISTIKAPISGGVYYSTLSFSGEKRKIQVGDNVWSGQNIAYIPDMSAFNFTMFVREFDVSKINTGMGAQIVLDSVAGVSLVGKVKIVNRIASNSNGKTDINLYPIEIELDPNRLQLHTGMQGQADVVVDAINNALAIPVSSLKQEGKKNYVLNVDGDKKYIEIGRFDSNWIEVISGLDSGDVILK